MSSIIYSKKSDADIKTFQTSSRALAYFDSKLEQFKGLYEAYNFCLKKTQSSHEKGFKEQLDFFKGKFKVDGKIYRYSLTVDEYNIIISNNNKDQSIIVSNIFNHPIQVWKRYYDNRVFSDDNEDLFDTDSESDVNYDEESEESESEESESEHSDDENDFYNPDYVESEESESEESEESESESSQSESEEEDKISTRKSSRSPRK